MAWGSQDGHGNDYPYGYHYLPVEDSVSQKPWKGGLNLTTLKLAEEYALEFANGTLVRTWIPPTKDCTCELI